MSRGAIHLKFVLLAVIAVSLGGCTSSESTVIAPRPMLVKLQPVSREEVNDSTTFMGTMKSRKSITLQPQVAGHITTIFVTAGALVAQGAPIIQIDPEKQLESVHSFSAAADASEQDRQTGEQTLRSLQASRLSKEADVKFFKQQVERYSSLHEQGAVAKESVDTFIDKLSVAKADLAGVDAQIEAQKSANLKMSRVAKQSDASRKEQQVQLQYFTVRAPFAGVVGDIPPKLGEYVDSNSKLTTITQNQPLEAYINIPAERSPSLKMGLPVELLDSNNKRIGQATVTFISPHVDTDTQSILIKALYDNSSGLLRSDQAVTARVVWSRQPQLLVPTFSVSHISGQDFVFVAEPAAAPQMIARQKPVVLGDIQDNKYVVKSGLQDGENIVVSGVQNLTDKTPILADRGDEASPARR
jgi:multidrug efflux pump subunit AcrA (membrane-fusion protein)